MGLANEMNDHVFNYKNAIKSITTDKNDLQDKIRRPSGWNRWNRRKRKRWERENRRKRRWPANDPSFMYMDESKGASRGNIPWGNFNVLSQYKLGLNRQTNVFKEGGLGNRYFYETSIKCNNKRSSRRRWKKGVNGSYNRSILIDNRPKLNKFGKPTGLLNSMLTSIKDLIPMNFTNEYNRGTENDCRQVNVLEKIQNDDGYIPLETRKTVYMTPNDIRDVHPCFFTNKKNPITKKQGNRCAERFTTIAESENYSQMPDDKLIQLYLTTITILGMYVVLKLVSKH